MINLMEKRYDAPKYVLWCVFMILVLLGGIIGYTKIYNVVSFTCLIHGEWDGSPIYVRIRENAQAGDAGAQVDLGWHYVSGACVLPSAERRKIGLQWLQKAAQSAPGFVNVVIFHRYARLYVGEEPSFLPVANRLVMNTVETEDTEDNLIAASRNKALRLHKAIIQCERGEQEWQQCRKIMRAATDAADFDGKWYYAEILARGLGGDADRDRAIALIDELIANEARDFPRFNSVSGNKVQELIDKLIVIADQYLSRLNSVRVIEWLQMHKKNLFLSNIKGVE